MKRFAFAAAVMAALTAQVCAADLPIRTNVVPAPQLALTTSGPYFGLWVDGGMGSVQGSAVQTFGVNPNTITSTEAAAGGLVGYYWALPNNCATCFAALEAWLGVQQINGNAQGFSFNGPTTWKLRAMYGADAATIQQVFPNIFNFNFPAFPSSLGNITNIKPYIYGSADGDDISLNVGAVGSFRTIAWSPEFGVGLLGQLTNSTAIDVFAGIKLQSKGVCTGFMAAVACAGMGNQAVVGTALKW